MFLDIVLVGSGIRCSSVLEVVSKVHAVNLNPVYIFIVEDEYIVPPLFFHNFVPTMVPYESAEGEVIFFLPQENILFVSKKKKEREIRIYIRSPDNWGSYSIVPEVDSSSPVAFAPPSEPGFLASVRFAHFSRSRARIPFESRIK